jgi:hypothetical protein
MLTIFYDLFNTISDAIRVMDALRSNRYRNGMREFRRLNEASVKDRKGGGGPRFNRSESSRLLR